MFEQWKERIAAQADALDKPEHVRALADIYLYELYTIFESQDNPSLLLANLSQMGRPKKEGNSWAIGVGNKGKIGEPGDRPPSHTIADFLAAFPQYKSGRGSRTSHRYAWWLLSHEAKEVLKNERAMGRFGGETGLGAGRSPWFWAQDGSMPEGAASAAAARITPKLFMRAVLAMFEAAAKNYARKVMQGSVG